MLFNAGHLVLILSISTFSNGLPLESVPESYELTPRAKSYSIVNVDGGATSAPAPPEPTTVQERTTTQTVKFTTIVPIVTSIVTATVVDITTVPASNSETSTTKTTVTHSAVYTSVSTFESAAPSSPTFSRKPTKTSKPAIVTITVTAPVGPTEYYDNGMWHTSYVIKSISTR